MIIKFWMYSFKYGAAILVVSILFVCLQTCWFYCYIVTYYLFSWNTLYRPWDLSSSIILLKCVNFQHILSNNNNNNNNDSNTTKVILSLKGTIHVMFRKLAIFRYQNNNKHRIHRKDSEKRRIIRWPFSTLSLTKI